MPRKYSEEWDYVCPKCENDDTDISDQEDLIDDYSGQIIGIKRNILCNECGHEWLKKHKYPKDAKEEEDL